MILLLKTDRSDVQVFTFYVTLCSLSHVCIAIIRENDNIVD